MKIAIIGPAHPYRGGLAAYNERLARQFIKQGHEVIIYTFSLQYPSFLFPGKSQYSTDNKPEGLEIIRCVNAINPFNWLKIGRKIAKENFNMVMIRFWLPFMGPSLGTILRIIKKNSVSKVICLVDNIIPHEARIGDKWFTKYFVKPVDAFVAMSQNVFDDLDLFVNNKPKILSPHPLFDNFGDIQPKELSKQKLQLEVDTNYIMFFGLVRKYKGLDLLLKAFALKNIGSKNLKLIVAGEYYHDKAFYTNLITDLGIEKDVVLVDKFIPDREVKWYFSACDVIVQPYKSATQSGVTQIAYHFNKPMIVTDVGGLKELCPDGKVGFVVKPTKQEIANAIVKFYQEDMENEMVEHIKEEKKKFAWDIMANNMLDLAK